MRALAFRSVDGSAMALVPSTTSKSGWEIKPVRTDSGGFGAVFDTLSKDLFMVLDADPVGGGLYVVGAHGGFTVEERTADECARSAAQNRDTALALESMADKVWKGTTDSGGFTLGVNRGAKSIRG